MRNRISRKLAVCVLALALGGLPTGSAQAFGISDITGPIKTFFKPLEVVVKPIEIGVDLLIIRPLAVSSLIVGATMLGPALLISAPNLSTTMDEAIENFVEIPFEDAFTRELGSF